MDLLEAVLLSMLDEYIFSISPGYSGCCGDGSHLKDQELVSICNSTEDVIGSLWVSTDAVCVLQAF